MEIRMATALVALQTSNEFLNRETLLVVFVGIIAVCVLLLTLGLVGAAIAALKAKSDAEKAIERLKQQALAKATPLLNSAAEIAREMTPKVRSITEDVAEIAHVARAQVTDIDSTLSDVTSKTRSQVDRVNGMVTSTLDTTAVVVSNLQQGIRAPIREVSGVLSGLKAGLEVLTGRREAPARSQVRHAAHAAEGQGRMTALEVEGEVRAAQAHVDSFVREVHRSAGAVDAGMPMAGTGRSVVDAGVDAGASGDALDAMAPEPVGEIEPENAAEVITGSGTEMRDRRR